MDLAGSPGQDQFKSSNLKRIPFTESLLTKVQGFDCGSEPWEREVADWLKGTRGTGGALDDLARGTEIWLYATPEGELVRVGSLGIAEQRWPRSKDPKVPVSIIPMVGVDRKFQGQPPGPSEQRYASQILSDLVAEAKRHEDARPILILYVNEQNHRAIRFYERFNFIELQKPFTDPATGSVNKRMALVLKTSPGAGA